MKPERRTEVSPPEYACEREALDYRKARPPGGKAFRGWSSFESIAVSGSINEIDPLVVSHSTRLGVARRRNGTRSPVYNAGWTWTATRCFVSATTRSTLVRTTPFQSNGSD